MTPVRLLTLALLLVAHPALAQDACLTGASRLGDERALADWRAAAETACPCAAAPKRSAYQHCARNSIEAAIANSVLRPQCRKQVTAIAKGAVCGSTRVACGRFAPGAREPVSCRGLAPDRCTDKPGKDQTACTEQTHCADVVDWTAGTCVDARADGPFAAGARVVTFTKPSVVDPMVDRVLDTTIWYPAAPGSGTIDPFYDAVLDAPLDLSGGPYPIVMFSHGSCSYPEQSIFLTALLAQHGFIVVAPPHPGNMIYDFPSCSSGDAIVEAIQERPRDVLYVLDQMLAADGDSLSPFFGSIDETKIGMMGHSFGGFTTYRVLALDSRFDVAIPLAPAVPPNQLLTVPSLHMMGEIDSLVNNAAIQTTYNNALPPKYLVEILDAGHYAFSNGCFAGPDCNPPATLTQPESHALVRRFVLPFLKVYLAGDTSFLPFLVPPPSPAVVFQAEP
jgi:predicted dienelactone hydrolase